MSQTNLSFGEYIRKLREDRNLPLRKIAAQLDIDTSTLGKIERNERSPNPQIFKKLSKIFKVDEKKLKILYYSDFISTELIKENLGREVLKVAEQKIEYKTKHKIKNG